MLRAQAQQPRLTDPSVLDPTYNARKQQLAQPLSPPPAATIRRGIQPPGTPLPECFEPLDKTTFTALPRNDDGFFGPINLGFQFFLFGTPYTQVYINTNGNITFNAGLEQYNAAGFPISTPMLAPFWADVDTRTPSTGTRGQVWYRLYNDRLVVTWDSVGYFSNQIDKKNNFQLTIYANAGGTLTQDVVFAYGDMQWTTGSASGGAGGFGGTPATAGINEGGTGGRFTQIGRFNLDGYTYNDNTSNSGIDYLDYKCFGFRVYDAGNQPPAVAGLPLSGAITVDQGQTVNLTPQFTGPEANQTVTVNVQTNGLCNTTAAIGLGANPTVNFSVTGAPCNIGTHTITFQAQDNGTPVANATYTLTVVVNPPVNAAVWDGDVSTDYLLAANWQGDVQPQPADSVLIPASAPRFPVLDGAATSGTFRIRPGASMTISALGVLTVNGDLRTNGILDGTGVLELSGTARQNIGGTALLRVGELQVGAAGALQLGSVAVRRILDLTGALTTNGQSLTLLSDASTTAMAINRGTGRVIGNATVQRYISPALNSGLGYRHLSAPVTGVTMGSIASAGFTPVLNTAYNTLGNTARPFPNMFGYDQARVTTSGSAGATDFDKGFFVPAATTTAFANAKGYTVNMLPSATLAFTGALHNGTFNSGNLARGLQTQSGWHLLGNPFPAPIDWDAAFASATGLENAVYVFKSSGQYAGSYEAYVNGIGSARFIGIGQGFFVRTALPGTNGQLNLTNAARVTSYLNPTVNRSAPTAGDRRPQLRLELVASTQQQDAAYVYFESGATPAFDRAYDAVKLPGGNQLYLASGLSGEAFSINGLPALTAAGATVPLLTYVPAAGTYTLRVGELKNFGTTSVQLEDRLTGRWQDLRTQPSLSFQASRPDAAATRFVLHIGQARALATAAATLPADAVSLWPNPASEALSVNVSALPAGNEQLQLSLLNVLGQVALQQQVPVRSGSASATLALSGLAPGVYTLRGTSSTHSFTRSVVVR
ncbi:hypothetical protein GCM10023185_18380 [Hymenobacter saemangeumensis]|uniref:T9SS type A sorting domain-containing protein n=1 Tax=Hymenobacter saemangeumensis TaxID=1084522 RepID=A0ABP8IC06_9BACT